MKTKIKKIAMIAFAILLIIGRNSFGQNQAPHGWSYANFNGIANNKIQIITEDSIFGIELLVNDTVMIYTNDGGKTSNILYSGFDKKLLNNLPNDTLKLTMFDDTYLCVYKSFPDGTIYATYSGYLLVSHTNGLFAYYKQTISYVTVDSSGFNKIVWNSTPNVGIKSYKIYNAEDTTKPLGSVKFRNGVLSFIDSSSIPEKESYTYKISVDDTNNLESDLSVGSKTIHVAYSGNEIIVTDKPTGFNYNYFFIFKGNDSINLLKYDSIPSTDAGWTDPKSSKGYDYYKVGVIVPSLTKGSNNVIWAFSNVVNNRTTGIENLNEKSLIISVYPNPTFSQITIDCGSNFSTISNYTLKITNTLGQTVYSSLVNRQISTINLNSWTGKGVYAIQLIDGNGNIIVNQKIVLE